MGKFNLSSVYTSDNIYSVLKLLKALIDTLDTYSFEEPILDKDGNPIPMDWFKNLYNSIHGDSNGNVEIGKDAHVDGNINADLSAIINGSIKLEKNRICIGYNTVSPIYLTKVLRADFASKTEYPAIIQVTSNSYNCFLFNYNNIEFCSSPSSALTFTDEGITITETPLVNFTLDFENVFNALAQYDTLLLEVNRCAKTDTDNTFTNTQYFEAPIAVKSIFTNMGSVNIPMDSLSGTLAVAEEIEEKYQKKLFIHTIHIQGALSDGGLPFNVCFTALLNNNTPIDSVPDLITQLNGTRYACTGYATSHPVYIDIGATAAATVICVTDDTGARDIALSAVSNISIQDNVFTTA